MKDFRVANLHTFPVQVNTARREVRVYTNIEVDIRYEGVDTRNSLPHWPTRISENFLPWYRLFLDWEENEIDEYELYRGDVFVVMRNHDALMDLMEPWIEWKRQKGFELNFLTDDDVAWNSGSIRNELINRYNNSENYPDYVVIVGDATGTWSVPASSGYGDVGYGRLAGDDNLIDLMVGRISVESASDVSAYVNKVLSYESEPYIDDTDWYKRAHIAVSSTSSGIHTVFTLRYHRRAMFEIGYTQVDTAFISPWGPQNNRDAVNALSIQKINAGVSFYGSRGYVGAGLNTTQISNLTNTNLSLIHI